MGTDEEGTLARLKDLRARIIDPAISSHRGRIVKTTGDGLLVEFSSAVDAVRSGVEVQRQIGEGDHQLELRIGIHVGDIIIDDNDIFGDGVNIAARLESIADPGGVCISDDAFRHVRGKVGVEFDDMGSQQLKNIAEPMRTWRARLGHAPRTDSTSAPLPLPDKPSIAVLPFQNMSGDPEQEYFADGVVEDIITALSRFKSLFVIARNSSFTYKGKAVDVRQVGRDLGVRYVLEGSVRKSGGRVRITGQLIDAVSGIHLWADHFDGNLADLFDLQDSITMSVVGAIAPRLIQAEIDLAQRRKPDSATSYDHFMRGMALNYRGTAESNREAIAEFRKALALDPDYAPAHARIANCIYQGRSFYFEPISENDRLEALKMAAIACDLAPDDAMVLSISTFVFGSLNDEFERGAACADRAVIINPNLAAAWNARGWMYLHLGEPEIAFDSFGRSLRLNPLDPILRPRITFGYAAGCFLAGKYDEGVHWCEKLLAEPPFNLYGMIMFVANASRAGRGEEARKMAERIRMNYPNLRAADLRLIFRVRKPDHQELIEAIIQEIGLS
jgi:TolB-like protein/Tfp pilus assembly protein PilF